MEGADTHVSVPGSQRPNTTACMPNVSCGLTGRCMCCPSLHAPHPFLPHAGEVPFRSDNGDEGTDAAFLQSLRTSLGVGGGEGEQAGTVDVEAAAGGCVHAEGLSKLRLAEADVAKVRTCRVWCEMNGLLYAVASDSS